MGMPQDESSSQELAARLAREEQIHADLLEKLANAQTGQQVSAPESLGCTETLANKIGRITPSGTVTEFAIPTPNSDPEGITAGPNGDLWFTETLVNKIGRITPSGNIDEFAVPTPNNEPGGITAGPDG